MSILKLSDKNQKNHRLKVQIKGAVQGVGFRPFVYRLAKELGLAGWVCNSPQGVMVEIEGEKENLNRFKIRLQSEKPPLSTIQALDYTSHAAVGYQGFKVESSQLGGDKSALILPDIALCKDCLSDIFDPDNRRYQYPFANCTNCGPRFSIIESLPYDRENTTMKIFTMCHDCREEYENPADRRFHAQPNACPRCGPHIELWNKTGDVLKTHHEALLEAADSIRRGEIVAMKGLGGFQLIVDARNEDAVQKLRLKKNRPEKPLAVMYHRLEAAEIECEITQIERKLLSSPESPIVLLKRKKNKSCTADEIAQSVVLDNPYLGVMLPYTPLHYLLMRELRFPVVATSGNYSDETICIDENDALKRLSDIADLFLVHNRPITRPIDDSVVRVIMNKQSVLRRARGYAPLPINVTFELPEMAALGGQQKNTIAIAKGRQVFISQHIGDLENKYSYETFVDTLESLSKLFDLHPHVHACDKHPDYNSSKFAAHSGHKTNLVQHHYAHVLSCMAENNLKPTVLGVAWDGTGYGDDGTIWGGEFIKVDGLSYSRVAHLRTFRLPGGDKAIKEPWRTAMGLLYEIFGSKLFDDYEFQRFLPTGINAKNNIRKMLEQNINTPSTSSAGRLFDAVASIIGLCQTTSFEGQAAMKLEFAAETVKTDITYMYEFDRMGDSYILNWEPMIIDILNDCKKASLPGFIAAKFHNTLAKMIAKTAALIGEQKVVLTGGCFQNKYLTEQTITRLSDLGFQPYWHHKIPSNDGGICLGQLVACTNKMVED